MIAASLMPGLFMAQANPSTTWRVISMWPWSMWIALVLLAAAVLSVLWTYRSLKHNVEKRMIRIIIAVRCLILVMAASIAALPVLQEESVQVPETRTAVIIDASQSMSMQGSNSISRFKKALGIAEKAKAVITGAEDKNAAVDFYLLDRDIRKLPELEDARGTAPSGDRSDLVRAVTDTVSRYSHMQGPSAVVLISDGINSSGKDGVFDPGMEAALKKHEIPVNTISITDQDGIRDLSIRSVNAPPWVFAGESSSVEVNVTADGYESGSMSVMLLHGESIVQKKTVSVRSGTTAVSFDIRRQTTGNRVYRAVIAPPDSLDAVKKNNQRYFILRTLRSRIRVLHVSGSPSWDQRFLRDVLKKIPDVDLVSFYVLRTPSDVDTARGELSLIPFPAEELFERHLEEFDAVIMQNFAPGPYGVSPYLQRLVEHVRSGAGLAVTGGIHSFTGGGYESTPLADILPVKVLKPEASQSRSSYWSAGSFIPRLSSMGLKHPVTRMGMPSPSAPAYYASLPPLEGSSIVGPVQNQGMMLASHPSLRAGDAPMPVIAVGRAGKGRTMAVTTDSMWKWGFTGPMTGSDAEALSRFWKWNLRWLTSDPSLDRLGISLDRPVAKPGQEILLDISVLDEAYSAQPGSSLEVEIASSTGNYEEKIEAISDSQGHYRKRLALPAVGAYSIRAKKNAEAEWVSTEFLVENPSSELYELSPRPSFLAKMAEITGGNYAQAGIPEHGFTISKPPRPRAEYRSNMPLWSGPVTLLLFIALLLTEWILRRKAGVP